MESEVARGFSDAFAAPEDDGERDTVAQRVVDGRVRLAGEAGVFGEMDIPGPVVLVSHGPVAAVPGQQLFRGAPFFRDGGDAVGQLPALVSGTGVDALGARRGRFA